MPAETPTRSLTQEENGSGPGSPVGHRSVALENRPGHRRRTRLDRGRRYQPAVRYQIKTLTPFYEKRLSNQSSIEPQGGTLLGDEAGRLEQGSSVRWGALRPRRLPKVRHDIMGVRMPSDCSNRSWCPAATGQHDSGSWPCEST